MLYKVTARNILTKEEHFFLTSDDDKEEYTKLEDFIYDRLKNIFYKEKEFNRDQFNLIILENKCFGCLHQKLDQRSHSECNGCLHDKNCRFCK